MNLAEQYARQFAWRDWPRALSLLPDVRGQFVVDLGCAHGDLAAVFAARGASVLGIDANAELIEAARARGLARTRFEVGDVRNPAALAQPVDGLWCSFGAAYLLDLPRVLERWRTLLRPGAWVALTEIDDLFAHEPLAAAHERVLAAFVDEALAAGRYDFRKGRKLAAEVTAAGFVVERETELVDHEFAATGAVLPEVLTAWADRFERLQSLRHLAGDGFASLREAFLACLAAPQHRSRARVCYCVARVR